MHTEAYPTEPRARVLVIDDEQPARTMVRRTLERAGYEVIEVATGEDGITFLTDDPKPHTVAAVLCDIRLPGQSGQDTIRQIRTSWPRVSVIVFTADTDMNVAYTLIKLGISAYLLKPALPDHVLVAVGNAITEQNAHQTRIFWAETHSWSQRIEPFRTAAACQGTGST
jgi:two-component system chemotaxis response regulator CheY